MTRDDIRKLLGGYATGSLSEAERKALFEAALDDQELFDELAQEQALKEVLEEPGAKQRLIAALEPRQKAWWLRPWPWVAAAAAAVVVLIALWRPPAREEIAEVRVPAPRLEAPPPAVNAPAQPPGRRPASPPAQARRQEPLPGPPLELRKVAPAEFPNSFADKEEAPKVTEAAPTVALTAAPVPPPPQSPAPSPTILQTDSAMVNGALPLRAPAAQQGQQGQAPGGRGGGGGRGGARAAIVVLGQPGQPADAKNLAANAPARFAFDYSVTPDRRLRILPASDGFLTVSVSNGDTSQTLVSSRPTQAASTVDIPLPDDSTVATIVFTRNAGTGAEAFIGGAVDALAGTKRDPAPSPNSRLQAIIPLPPRE